MRRNHRLRTIRKAIGVAATVMGAGVLMSTCTEAVGATAAPAAHAALVHSSSMSPVIHAGSPAEAPRSHSRAHGQPFFEGSLP